MIDHLLDILLLAQETPLAEVPEQALEVVEAAASEVTKAAHASQRANLGYLVAAILFILGIKGMTHPRTAVRGNQLGALGMLIAVVVTLLSGGVNWATVILGMAIGIIGLSKCQSTGHHA